MKIFQLIDMIIRLFRLNKKSKVVLLFLIPTFLVGQNNAAFWLGKRASGAAPTNLLLDDYPGAAAAYSLRKLDKDYGGFAVEVRRSNDGNTQNIGFSNGDFDTASLSSFCAGTSCTVRTWYDQSGNNDNLQITTTANQPIIFASGVVKTAGTHPAIQFDGINDYLKTNTDYPTGVLNSHFYIASSTGTDQRVLDTRGTGAPSTVVGFQHKWSNSVDLSLVDSGSGSIVNAGTRSGYKMVSIFLSNTYIKEYTNGGGLLQANGSIGSYDSTRSLYVGINANTQNAQIFTGFLQEIILYNNNQEANKLPIETNINSYYSIY